MYAVQHKIAALTESALVFQSCAEGEEGEEEEGKEKTFEVLVDFSGECGYTLDLKHIYIMISSQEKEMEKQKMLYQQARLHDRGAAEMVLQMISASKGTVWETHGPLSVFMPLAPLV